MMMKKKQGKNMLKTSIFVLLIKQDKTLQICTRPASQTKDKTLQISTRPASQANHQDDRTS